MRLSSTDIKILKVIRQYPAGVTIKIVKNKLSKDRFHIYRRIERLSKRKLLLKIGKKPVIYKFNKKFNSMREETSRFEAHINCHRCKKLWKIHEEQKTKQCVCYTDSGKRTRIKISEDKILYYKKII